MRVQERKKKPLRDWVIRHLKSIWWSEKAFRGKRRKSRLAKVTCDHFKYLVIQTCSRIGH